MDTRRAFLLVLGIFATSFGLAILIAMGRSTKWDVARRELASVPGSLLFSGAMLASLALGSLTIAVGFAVCLFVSQIVGTALWLKGKTAHDVLKKQNKER